MYIKEAPFEMSDFYNYKNANISYYISPEGYFVQEGKAYAQTTFANELYKEEGEFGLEYILDLDTHPRSLKEITILLILPDGKFHGIFLATEKPEPYYYFQSDINFPTNNYLSQIISQDLNVISFNPTNRPVLKALNKVRVIVSTINPTTKSVKLFLNDIETYEVYVGNEQHPLSVFKFGFQTYSEKIRVTKVNSSNVLTADSIKIKTSAKSFTLKTRLENLQHIFSGLVTEQITPAIKLPIRCEVLLYDKVNKKLIQRTLSDLSGFFEFKNVAPREYFVVAIHPDKEYNSIIIDIIK